MKISNKGLSEMIGYVLLIVIAVSLSILVYAWLKNYIWVPQEKCDDGVSLVIEDYNCDSTGKILNLSIRNMGTFSADGFIIRAGNKTKAIYPLKASGKTSTIESDIGKIFFNESMKPDELKEFFFDYSKLGNIDIIEIEPIKFKESRIILCEEAIISQTIRNCGDAPLVPPEAAVPVMPSSLVSWWKFDDSVNLGKDSVDDNDGMTKGIPAQSTTTFKEGVGSLYLPFSVSPTNYLEVADKDNLEPATNLVIDLWIYPTRDISASLINKKGDYMISRNSDKKIEVTVGEVLITSSDITLKDNWYNIKVIWDGSQLKMDIDDIEQADKKPLTSVLYGTNNLSIGTSDSTTPNFVGYIDEVKIYNEVI